MLSVVLRASFKLEVLKINDDDDDNEDGGGGNDDEGREEL